MIDDDEPRSNSPEDIGGPLGWTRGVPPPVRPPPSGKFMATRKQEATTMATSKTTKEDEKPEEGARGFAPFLQQVDDGELHTELSDTVQKLIGELYLHANRYQRDAKGTLTLTLKFAVLGNGGVQVAGDVKTKTPTTPRAASMFFRTPGNNLSIENPRQQRLALREVPASKEKPRDIATEAAPPRGL